MALYPERAHDEIFFASAENAIAERGLDEITFDDLVRHIGVARSMLYRRYARRDAVIAAISELCFFFADIARSRGIAMSVAPFSVRLERINVRSLPATGGHPWRMREIVRSLSAASLEILSAR